MTVNVTRTLVIIAICVVCTFGLRLLPFALFGKREVPKPVQYLGRVLPMAIMTMLVVYCLKDVTFAAPDGWLPQAIALAVTVAVHLWRRNTSLSIILGTVCYMALVQLIF